MASSTVTNRPAAEAEATEGVPILLVDDYEANLVALEAILAPLGHQLTHARSGKAALRHVLEQEFAVILLDVLMPELDGFETARLIRGHRRSRTTPIIFLSAVNISHGDILEGYAEGGADYLVKPLDPAILRAKVEVFVALHRGREQGRRRGPAVPVPAAAHAAVLAERTRLQALLMQAPVAICVLTGPKLVFELANSRSLELLGRSDVLGKPLLEALPELAGQGFDHLLEQVRRSGEPFFGDQVVCKLDRAHNGSLTEMIFDFVYQPIRDADGAVESIMVVATDVTERVVARKRIEQARHDAAASEQKFQLLAEVIPQIVWSVSADGSETYLSPRWSEYTGDAPTNTAPDRWHRAIHPDDYDRCFAVWNAAARERRPWQLEYRLRRHDGEYRWHLGRSMPHCDHDGTILRWYGTATDIDEQRRAIRSRDDLLATVSHDLRGPLGTIAIAADLLAGAPGGERAIAVMRRAAKQMERLIQDLLDMASIESGHLSVTPAPRLVGELVAEAFESIQPLAASKHIALSTELDAAGLAVTCDRGRVLQVFANILGNAVKFTPASGAISIHAHARDGLVTVAIADTGPGIEARQLPYVFDRFWQAKETARAGTGLGLAICKGIIQQHGGSIWVESQVGVGTTFFFSLPLAPPAP